MDLNKIKINGKYLKEMMGMFEVFNLEYKEEVDEHHSLYMGSIRKYKHYIIIHWGKRNMKFTSQEIFVKGVYIDYVRGVKDFNIAGNIEDYMIDKMEW